VVGVAYPPGEVFHVRLEPWSRMSVCQVGGMTVVGLARWFVADWCTAILELVHEL
jgi:hypothetical protein